jgi:hypothetical protein
LFADTPISKDLQGQKTCLTAVMLLSEVWSPKAGPCLPKTSNTSSIVARVLLFPGGQLTRVMLLFRVALSCCGCGGPCHGRGENIGAGEREHAGRGLWSGARHECIQVLTRFFTQCCQPWAIAFLLLFSWRFLRRQPELHSVQPYRQRSLQPC